MGAIMSERTLTNARMGRSTYGDITNKNIHPKTALLFEKTMPDLETLIFLFKEEFNRVRPSFLDPTLSTVIEVPGHPAYPSGHATQSYFIALIMSTLNPEEKDTYIQDAYRIAHNREIAGVHYPSDSEAGRILAQAVYDVLQDNEIYKKLFNDAKTEWPE